MSRAGAWWALAAAVSSGCLAYNDQCTALVANPNEVVVTLGEDVYLDRPNARHDDNAIGQAGTDAFVDVFSGSRAVDFAVMNGGSLRSEGICGVTRNIVPRGELTDQVLHEILLFENIVNAVDVTEDEVNAMFEHSVEQLYPAGSAIASPAGSFLQVSSTVSMTVDCNRPAGSRVTALSIGGQSVSRPGRVGKLYRVALSSFLLGGADGYTMLTAPGKDPSRHPSPAQKFGGIDSNITADYLRRFYKAKNTPLVKDPSRVKFTNCAVPARPAL